MCLGNTLSQPTNLSLETRREVVLRSYTMFRPTLQAREHYVPFVKRPFEWGIHGSANLATFCCVLRVTCCHRVRFSCYLRQNGATINASKFKVLPSRLFPHIRCSSVEFGANSPKFTQDSLQIQGCEFVRISDEFVPICTLSLSYSTLIAFRYLIMSQTLSQLASLQSRPDAAADTLAQHQAPHRGWIRNLGTQTPAPWHGPSNWGYGLPRLGVAPRPRDTDSHAVAWPSDWGNGLPRLAMANGLEDTHSYALAWPLELGIQTPSPWRDPSSWGYGLPCLGVALGIGDTDSHALVPPLKWGIRSPTPCRGTSTWGYGLPRIGEASQVGDSDSHALAWPLELGLWTPKPLHGPWTWGYGLFHLGVASQIVDTDSHAFGIGVVPLIGDTDSHRLAWPLEWGIRTPTPSPVT